MNFIKNSVKFLLPHASHSGLVSSASLNAIAKQRCNITAVRFTGHDSIRSIEGVFRHSGVRVRRLKHLAACDDLTWESQ